jgi:hypothetical protein
MMMATQLPLQTSYVLGEGYRDLYFAQRPEVLQETHRLARATRLLG